MATAAPPGPPQQSQARPWNPNYTHSDRERWVCIYPAYVNNKKTVAEGRKVPKEKGVENPQYGEIRDVLAAAGCVLGVENKVYPRERDTRDLKFRGRIRVQLRNDDGSPKQEEFPNRKSLLMHLGATIPKLKSRQGGPGSQASSQQQGGGGGGKKKKGKKK